MLCMSFITFNSVFHLFSHLYLIITAVLSKILFPLYEHYVYSFKWDVLSWGSSKNRFNNHCLWRMHSETSASWIIVKMLFRPTPHIVQSVFLIILSYIYFPDLYIIYFEKHLLTTFRIFFFAFMHPFAIIHPSYHWSKCSYTAITIA